MFLGTGLRRSSRNGQYLSFFLPWEGHLPESRIFGQVVEGDRVKLEGSPVHVVFEPPSTLLASPGAGVTTIAATAATTVVDAIAVDGSVVSGAENIANTHNNIVQYLGGQFSTFAFLGGRPFAKRDYHSPLSLPIVDSLVPLDPVMQEGEVCAGVKRRLGG